MIDFTGVDHHPALEEIVDVLCNKTLNTDRGFFRVEVAFFLGKVAGSMRASIVTKDRGEIPVNIYALALGTSGYGKGHSVNVMEHEFLSGFKKRFMEDIIPVISEKHLWDIANERAARKGTDQTDEFVSVEAEYKRAGAIPFTFDSGTAPAVKQLRHKLVMGKIGAINLAIDEIGSNLLNNVEILTLFLELYDQGLVKQKLTKNTSENIRGEELDGKTPTNMLLFGTPSKLFDGSQTEDHFYSFLETGYARRCLFGVGHQQRKAFHFQTPEEIYRNQINPQNTATVDKWADHFLRLADPAKYGWKAYVSDEVAIALLTYKIECEKAAELLPEHEEIQKAELSHRYFKALKLAGAYAFLDESNDVEMLHLLQAIKLVEESGESFKTILSREKNYVKLAKYIADVGTDVTHADLHEALPFYKSGNAARNEMMTLAIAWGYKQHIIIKKTYVDGIDFFKGEKLEETDLQEMTISYGEHWAYDYLTERVPFDQLHTLMGAVGFHWCNHGLKNGHRSEETVLPGFNMVVLDIDGGVSLETVHELMKEYKFMTYTTKRHTVEQNRFRLILPINYNLQLDTEEYKDFMNALMEWLPFDSDESSNQRAKKWETFENTTVHYNNEGHLLDALKFIPKTRKNEEYVKERQAIQSMDNLERWFAERIARGNRNNQMIKFAMALVDSGMNLIEVSDRVRGFNKKLENPLPEAEINNTILTTVAKRLQEP
jgi:hypothetical protein